MTTMLEVCGLGKAFNGNTVLDHIDLSVAPGTVSPTNSKTTRSKVPSLPMRTDESTAGAEPGGAVWAPTDAGAMAPAPTITAMISPT